MRKTSPPQLSTATPSLRQISLWHYSYFERSFFETERPLQANRKVLFPHFIALREARYWDCYNRQFFTKYMNSDSIFKDSSEIFARIYILQ